MQRLSWASADFLEAIQSCCETYGALSIFDEVMTGFRVSLSGAQGYLNFTPDLTSLGKVVGGGLPCAAYGGRQDIMDNLAPLGSVYQAGTLSGNPCAMAAGLATLTHITQPLFDQAVRRVQTLLEGVKEAASKYQIPLQGHAVGPMFTFFLTESPVTCLESVQTCDFERFALLYQSLLSEGVYMAPSQYEANFISVCHSDDDISKTIDAFEKSFKRLCK